MFYCFKGKGSSALLFSRERNRCTTVIKEKETGAILLMFQEKETGALLFSRRRKLALYCSCFRRRGLVLYCSQVKGDWAVLLLRTGVVQGAVPSLLVDSAVMKAGN